MYSICIFLNTNFNKKKHFFHIFKPCLIKFPARMKAAAASVTIIPTPYLTTIIWSLPSWLRFMTARQLEHNGHLNGLDNGKQSLACQNNCSLWFSHNCASQISYSSCYLHDRSVWHASTSNTVTIHSQVCHQISLSRIKFQCRYICESVNINYRIKFISQLYKTDKQPPHRHICLWCLRDDCTLFALFVYRNYNQFISLWWLFVITPIYLVMMIVCDHTHKKFRCYFLSSTIIHLVSS